TRLQGGKDSASPRYIFTRLDDLTPLMIRTEDDIILERAIDDGIKIEPTVYAPRSEEHTSELQSRENLVCRLLLEKKKKNKKVSKDYKKKYKHHRRQTRSGCDARGQTKER